MDEGLKIRLGADITDLQKGLKTAEASVANFGKTVNKSVQQANQAFTNLSRVVSDAPFGFIAIQNNLDPLVQSFQSLKQSTGSTGGALKALGASLVGGGGVLFAFSAVSSIVTGLIQKYGSLGAAITELSASQERSAVAQRAINSELAKGIASQTGEINTVKNLVSILNDANASQIQRTNAYKELKKEFPGVIQNLTEENALTRSGGELIAARSVQLIKYIQLKAKEAALIKLGEQATLKELEAAKNGIEILKNQGTFLNQVINTIAGGGIAGLGLARRINAQSDEFKSAAKDAKAYADGLLQVQKELATFDPKLTGLEKVTAPKLAKGIKVPEVRIIPDRIQLDVSQFNAEREIGRSFNRENGLNVPLNITVPESAFASLKAFGESQYWKLIENQTKGIISQFNDFLTPVINTAFEALGNGSNIIKAIGQSLKALVLQIGATIAKAAILAGILSAIFPGGAVVGGSAVKGFGGIFKSILGFGQTASPNFSGVQGGGLSVTVGGQFNVRGTDLVAVVSQGNQRIGRVG